MPKSSQNLLITDFDLATSVKDKLGIKVKGATEVLGTESQLILLKCPSKTIQAHTFFISAPL